MNAPKLDPRFVSEIAWQKNRAIANNVRWVRMFRACSIASVVLGVGAWFLCFPEPTDRDWGTACGMVVSAWLVGICLLSLFGSKGSDHKWGRKVTGTLFLIVQIAEFAKDNPSFRPTEAASIASPASRSTSNPRCMAAVAENAPYTPRSHKATYRTT